MIFVKIASTVKKSIPLYLFWYVMVLLWGTVPMWAQVASDIEFENGKVVLDAQDRSLRGILYGIAFKADFQLVFDRGLADRAVTVRFSLPLEKALKKLLSEEEYLVERQDSKIVKMTVVPKDPANRLGLETTPPLPPLPGHLPPPPIPTGQLPQPPGIPGTDRFPPVDMPQLPPPDALYHGNPEAVVALMTLQKEYPNVMVIWHPVTGFPSSLFGRLSAPAAEKPVEIAQKFLARHRDLFGIVNPQQELQLDQQSYPPAEPHMPSHILYWQQYQGIKIYNHSLAFHLSSEGIIEMVEGNFLSGVQAMTPSQPKLTPAQAAQILRGDIKDHKMADPATGKEMTMSMVTTPSLAWYPKDGANIYLTWHADVTDIFKPESRRIFIDAISGKRIAQENLLMDFRFNHK
jgi:hypothetical protein